MTSKSTLPCSLRDSSVERGKPCSEAQSINRKTELWLAVHLPRLALEVAAKGSHLRPLVIIEEINGRQFIHIASAAAEGSGVVAGMSLSTAYARCPDLQVHHLDKIALQQRLQCLASWALQYSSRVSLQPPCSFLLEVKGSIQYFGDLDSIRKQITETLKNKWQHAHYLAISPTPAASLLLAESANEVVINDIADLRSALGDLSIGFLPLDKKRKRQLQKTGVRVLRDLWRLPPAALARRFGTDLTCYLDHSLGKLPHPLPGYRSPPRFEAVHDLSCAVCNYHLLLPYAHALLRDLCHFLQRHDVYTSNFIFYFQHEHHLPTTIHIGLRQTLRDAKHFIMLLETKISQMTLPAPVLSMKLIAETLHAYTTQTADLFPLQNLDGNTDVNIEDLLEQLSSRLGHKLISGIASHEDHRPEYAHRNSDMAIGAYTQTGRPRPLWLLASPAPLSKKNNRLYYKSVIRFSMGPERIEAGWWDGVDIRRDYYIGIDEVAGSLWIYHDLKDKQLWYVHGLFG